MNAIEVHGVQKSFSTKSGPMFRRKTALVEALRGVDFEIPRGQIFSLLGPNGAGKTTLIKILATLLLPGGGSASVCGYDVVRNSAKVRQVLTAVLPGERTLFWKLSVRENLRYFASLYGLATSWSRPRIETLLEYFGMVDKADALVEKLSTGQRQKIVLCRALLPDPEVILLDEPTLGLDPTAAKGLREMIRTISEQGKTILLTTHYMYEADELSDRVAIINDGRIVCLDTPAALKASLHAEKILRLTTDSWAESLSTHLVEDLRIDGATTEFRSRDTDDSSDGAAASVTDVTIRVARHVPILSDVARFCEERHVKLHSFRVDEPTLEDVFIARTGSRLEKETAHEPSAALA